MGDDAAVLSPPSGARLAISTDTLVEGVHFFADMAPDDLAHKAAAVSLSDLAAMGARPLWMSVSLTVLASKTAGWFASFADGLRASAKRIRLFFNRRRFNNRRGFIRYHKRRWVRLIKRPCCVAAQKSGDDVWLSGVVGEAALAVAFRKRKIQLPPLSPKTLEIAEQRLSNPVARTCLGQKIAAVANAAIDLSDGLSAAANAIADASGVRYDFGCRQTAGGRVGLVAAAIAFGFNVLNGG